jgi:hypothetical protein
MGEFGGRGRRFEEANETGEGADASKFKAVVPTVKAAKADSFNQAIRNAGYKSPASAKLYDSPPAVMM